MSIPLRELPPRQPSQHNLEITIISGKHLKNVNWKNGSLKPYAIFWVDPDHKLTTKSDDCSDTKPVWNQYFTVPVAGLSDAVLTVEVFHSKSSETPKPYVGSTQVRISSLPESDNPNKIRTFDLIRPSGRPQGKIRLKVVVKEQPLVLDYQNAPHGGVYYYSSAPPFPYSSLSAKPVPPPKPILENFAASSAYPYSMGYYTGGYYSPPPPAPPSVMRCFSDRNMSYGAPSAPVDYSPYELRSRSGIGSGSGSRPGFGAALGVGAVAGVLGGLALEEGLKYEEEKIAERVEDNYLGGSSSTKDDFSEYHADY